MSNSKIAMRVSAELIEFSDSIKPSDGYITKGTELAEAVFGKLKGVHNSGTLSRFKVDRAVYGGSVGKNTSVIYPDFDCVVFLNNVQPPLTQFLNEFEIILRTHAQELYIVPESIKRNWLSITARFKNGVEMDLLPACNFHQDPHEQHRLVLEQIRENPSDCMLYSSSLAALQLNFIRTQSSFTHQLIRLAKYWHKSLSLDENVYGGSAMMEIICVAVIAENPPSMLDALKQFLRKIVEMDTLKIAFFQVEVYKNVKKRWTFIEERDIVHYEDHFDLNIISRSNYIIEPANPYNDMAENIFEEVFAKLKKFGTAMIKRVIQLEDNQTNEMITVDEQILTSINISRLFEPFPLVLSDEYPPDFLPTEALFDYQCGYSFNSAEPQLIINRSPFDRERLIVSKVILNNLAFLIMAPKKKEVRENKTYVQYRDGFATVTLNEVKGAVRRLTSVNFKSNCVKESSSEREHSSCDVTMYAPYYCNDKFAVRVSLKWPTDGFCIVI